MRKRLTKKRLKKHIDFLEKQMSSQTDATNSILGILQTSGIIETIGSEDLSVVAIRKIGPFGFGEYKVNYKVNEVF